MGNKKKSKKTVLKTYQDLKEKLSLLKYHELKGFGNEWNSDSDELDNDLLSLDTDYYRDNYLDEYLENLDKEIDKLDINSIEYLKKTIFRTFVIFKFYTDEYGFLDYYYELNDWYEEIYNRDNSRDKKIQSGFSVIEGGMK
tara:strand:- start:341 stop:763 length:423 start_codon:yes stop_codon:yes gene_type:complete